MSNNVTLGPNGQYESPQVQKALDHLEAQRDKRQSAGGGKQGLSSEMILGKFEDMARLMVASFKHQNPDKPMDANQMTEQFSMFAQLMGMSELKNILSQMAGGLDTGRLLQAAAQLDSFVKVKADSFNYVPGDKCELGYIPPADAKSAAIVITDEKDRLVKALDHKIEKTEDGHQVIPWDGKDSNGDPVKAGLYKFRVSPLDEKGEVMRDRKDHPIQVETSFMGRVSGGSFRNQEPHMRISGRDYPLTNLISIQSAKNDVQPLGPSPLPQNLAAQLKSELTSPQNVDAQEVLSQPVSVPSGDVIHVSNPDGQITTPINNQIM